MRMNTRLFNGYKLLGIASICLMIGLAGRAEGQALVDHGDTTLDPNSSLEWVDVSLTTNRSFADISLEFGAGGDFQGFRHATTQELLELFTNAGIPEVNGGFAVPNAPSVAALLSLVGSTVEGTMPDQAVIPGDVDFIRTQGNTDDMLSGVLELGFNRTNGFPAVGWASTGENLGVGMASVSGHWLVRAAQIRSDNEFFLSMRDCTGVAPDDSCSEPGTPTQFNRAFKSDFRFEVPGNIPDTMIAEPGFGSARGSLIFGGDLDTPTITNEVITTGVSLNNSGISGAQTFTFQGSTPTFVPFGGEFTYEATGTVDGTCRGFKDISDLIPGATNQEFVFDECGIVTVGFEVRNLDTGELLSPLQFVSISSLDGVLPSPLQVTATILMNPGTNYEVIARSGTRARGAGQRISALNSFVIGLIDPTTGAVTKDVPESLPELIGKLIPGSDSNQPSLIEVDVLPKKVRIGRRGVLPVALITTPFFYAPDIDRDSLTFGPNAARVAVQGGGPEDVDDDGDTDFVVHFRVQESGISCEDTEVFVAGMTTSGDRVVGSDTIVTKGCK